MTKYSPTNVKRALFALIGGSFRNGAHLSHLPRGNPPNRSNLSCPQEPAAAPIRWRACCKA